MIKKILLFASITLFIILISACVDSATTPTKVDTPVINEAEALINDKCSKCHTTRRVFQGDLTREEWSATIDEMIEKGAEVNEEEKTIIIDWLTSGN